MARIRVRKLATRGLKGLVRAGRAWFGVRRVAGYATAGNRMVPGVLVIGAQKSGTTSLFRYLCGFEEFARPERFELHYFDMNYYRDYRWYLSHFPLGTNRGTVRITGEKTPYYLFHPAVPARVKATLPGVKLIAVLRDPVKRAYSHYHHNRKLGLEPEPSFLRALEREEERLAGAADRLLDPLAESKAHQYFSYLSRGRYGEQMQRWLEYFPMDRILVLSSSELFREPRRVMEQVGTFLGIQRLRLTEFGVHTSTSYPPLSEEERGRLAAYYREYNERLFELVGREFDWER